MPPATVRNAVAYVLLLLVFGGAGWALLDYGRDAAEAVAGSAAESGPAAGPDATEGEPARHPLSILLLQLVVVIAGARLCGSLVRRAGQPAVIGEMAAGILLGPSVLGLLWPAAETFLFPKASLGTLSLLSQVGILLFMFGVGMELDLGALRKHAQTALFVSHASIVVPFFLGLAVALVLYPHHAPGSVGFVPFALFMGIAMSITAFPVLARILEERCLMGTPLGTTAMASAAVDDATAWSLLALVIAIARAQSPLAALQVAALATCFCLLMLFAVRPALARLAAGRANVGNPGKGLAAGLLVLVFLSALATDTIGIHGLFGAFLAGAIMPHQPALRAFLKERIEYSASLYLLPVFFAATGLRTQLNLLGGGGDWLLFLLIMGVAVAGKFGGGALAARFTGTPWRNSLALGALMNTRGLMELIVLNIGLELGILSPSIFSMMVLMALATTAMTGPALGLLGVGRGTRG